MSSCGTPTLASVSTEASKRMSWLRPIHKTPVSWNSWWPPALNSAFHISSERIEKRVYTSSGP